MDVNSIFPLYVLYTDNRESIDGATRFQKLVFLAQEETELPEKYTFRPDRFGPYSVELRRDLETLTEQGYIERYFRENKYGDTRIEYSLSKKGYRYMREWVDQMNNTRGLDIVQKIKRQYNDMLLNDLLQYVYGRYERFVTNTELDTGALFDPDARTEYTTLSSQGPQPGTVEAELRPTPHTLWQMPKRDTNAYFYYFTDATYSAPESKFRKLDDELTLLGRHRSGLEVIIVNREHYRMETWQAFLDGFGIDTYPAIVVSEAATGLEETDMNANVFEPDDVTYAKIENGIIQDSILSDPDDTKQFLNALFDAAFDNDIESKMRREKVLQGLKITKQEVMTILSISP